MNSLPLSPFFIYTILLGNRCLQILRNTVASPFRAQQNFFPAPVVQRLDNAIHRINYYPVDSVVCSVNTYPLDSNLSGG